MAQATASSSCPAAKNVFMWASNRPVLSRSEMMIGFEVAPVAPWDRFSLIRSGSTESSHNLVPVAASDCNEVMRRLRGGMGCE
jgi:hypothetical protein